MFMFWLNKKKYQNVAYLPMSQLMAGPGIQCDKESPVAADGASGGQSGRYCS
jgi:hypothetical protein